MKTKSGHVELISISLLITGNLVGAGVLALPINTGISGFVPSILGLLVVGMALMGSAIILGGEAIETRQEHFNYPSLYHKYLGGLGKWLAVVANLIILYGLLTAYITGASAIITNLFHIEHLRIWVTIAFFALVTGVNVLEMRLVRRYNALLMVLLWASFAVLVFITGTHVEPERLTYADWSFLPCAVPIIITAFHFHNLVPHVCHTLGWNWKRVVVAILMGMLVSFFMYAIWLVVGLGALPLADGPNSLLAAFSSGNPATVPLARVIGTPFFTLCSLLFALLAICTSYLANGAATLGFMADLTRNHLGRPSRLLEIALAFVPPLVISLIWPDIFLKALNVVGGLGVVLLFGILPSVIWLRKVESAPKKVLAWALLLSFSAFLIVEIAQESGMLRIRPEVEHWNTSDVRRR